MDKAKDYKPLILVYGIDKVGYKVPTNDIETKICKLHFEPFSTSDKFQDYDGVIIFQGTFEEVEHHEPSYASSYITIKCYREELQRRKKQYQLLREKRGFVCFLLIAPILDRDEFGDKSGTDLVKWTLNYSSFYRGNTQYQETSLKTLRNEFITFLKNYGAAYTNFSSHNKNLELKEICRTGSGMAGLILWNKEYFIPTLKPKAVELDEYFKLLGDSLLSCNKKLSEEIPEWADEYKFEEEKQLLDEKNKIAQRIDEIDRRLLQFREFKKCLCYDDDLLKESVIKIIKDGFCLLVFDEEEFREDFKIIDNDNNPQVLVEVKGTNKGITREFVNQADSHRERAELDADFPSILIVNTQIKKSNSLEDKYLDIAGEQVRHAVKMKVLAMRTIDLLNMLYHKEKGTVTTEAFLEILKSENGWLKTSQTSWNVQKE